jgi:hypothetical protein
MDITNYSLCLYLYGSNIFLIINIDHLLDRDRTCVMCYKHYTLEFIFESHVNFYDKYFILYYWLN